jgi:hypothetical protein
MERTTRTFANVSFDKMTHRQIPDGRQTMRQDIEHIRANNPDKLAPYGEFADNSVSWGKAQLAGQYIHARKIDMFDNGTFESEEAFKRAFTKHKDDSPEFQRYNSTEPILGKFNAGLTDSVILLGEDGSLIHHFGNGNYKKTKFSVEKACRDNNICENISIPSDDEIEEFLQYQYLIDPKYDQKTGRGTLLRIENLLRKNTQETFTNVARFMYGLYSPECHQQTTFTLYNGINPNNVAEGCIIAPNDLSFGASLCKRKTVYVYNDEKEEDKKIYTETKISTKTALYHFSLKIFFFDQAQTEAERKIFNNTTEEERVGFSVRRAGRLVSGITAKLWGLSTGAMRGKGIRIHIDIPPTDAADNDWCIGTFKKITDDTWCQFNSYLKGFLEKEFKDINRLQDEDRDIKRTAFVTQYTEKTKNIKNLTKEETKQILEETKKIVLLELENKGVIQKRSGNAYSAIIKYIEELELHAKSFEPKSIEPIAKLTEPVAKPEPVVVSVAPKCVKPLFGGAMPKPPVESKSVSTPITALPKSAPSKSALALPKPAITTGLPKPKPPVESKSLSNPMPEVPKYAPPLPKKVLTFEFEPEVADWLKTVGGIEYINNRYNIEKKL